MRAEQIERAMTALSAADPRIAAARALHGAPEPRVRPRGFATLLRTIVGQQVSVAAAASIWRKLEAATGATPDGVMAADDAALRAAGLSGQKVGYARSLAGEVLAGTLPLDALPADDEAAIAALTRVKGLGRWSAEIYLLFAESRADVFPAGDLAVQAQMARLLGLDARPTEKEARALAEGWRPHRGAAALFMWHVYNINAL